MGVNGVLEADGDESGDGVGGFKADSKLENREGSSGLSSMAELGASAV